MNLVERHIINKEHKMFKQCDKLCFLSKNLYNCALYTIKQEFLSTGKWLRYNQLDKIIKENYPLDYKALPSVCSQQILIKLDNNIKCYFEGIKIWKKSKKKFTGCPKFPKYKDKINGRNIVTFTVSGAKIKKDKIIFAKKSLLSNLTIKQNNFKQIRIKPQTSCYVIEVVYEKQETIIENKNNNWLSIDLGVNNLATCVSNNIKNGFIINGKPLKSINQYYNKKKSELQSKLKKNHNNFTSNRIQKLTLKRNNKINDYLHKVSKKIIDKCLEDNIDNIVIGKNDGWKQNVSLGKRTNQNFVQIPFENFIQKIAYKAKLKGLEINTINESYTSKCSALDLESIEKHEQYLGKRVNRGLFQTFKGKLINADINGALNILRKQVANDVLMEPICRGYEFYPLEKYFL
jgi:putative transposase